MAYGDELQRDLLFASVQNTDNAFNQACLANDQALRESGYLLGAVHLQGKSTTATARVQDSVFVFHRRSIARDPRATRRSILHQRHGFQRGRAGRSADAPGAARPDRSEVDVGIRLTVEIERRKNEPAAIKNHEHKRYKSDLIIR